MKVFLFSSLLLMSSMAFAQADFLTMSYQPEARMETMNVCYMDYQRRFKTPGILRIAVALGYSDTIDEGYDLVTDHWLLNSLIFQLTKKCEYSSQGFCEFTQLSSNGEHSPFRFLRKLETRYGEELEVHLYAINSSVDFSNEANQTKYKTEQARQSEAAQRFFGWGLQNADVVFYEGHSRDGGGPDFLPPRAGRNGKVHYSWYRKNQPGLKFLLNALGEARRPPSVLGLFSCASQGHFQKKLAPHLPDSNTIMSTKVVEASLTKDALMYSLEALLNFECGDDWAKRLRGTSFILNRRF